VNGLGFFGRLKEKISRTTEDVTNKFKDGLSKTRDAVSGAIQDLIFRTKKIDESFFEELEEILISADVGVPTVMDLMDDLRAYVKKNRIEDAKAIMPYLTEKLVSLLTFDGNPGLNLNASGLTVILVVGVNGVGKTTSIGKLTHHFKKQGKTVLLAAGDTFRAAAIEQLEVWGSRVGADVIHHQAGSDPAAVIYDAIQAAKSRKVDILICDTAGRLHNKANLMEELNKIYRIVGREIPDAPHEVLLVLDATTGQNAVSQAKLFSQSAGVSGIIMTKLDGTAKGGVVLAISQELEIPVKFIGLGEKADDLQPFVPEQFVHALFAAWIEQENDA
jgi:fused signal recognition particle receptor